VTLSSLATTGARMYNGVFDCVKKVASRNGELYYAFLSSNSCEFCLTSLRCALRVPGISGLYSGLTAGIMRQLVYGMPRMAFYTILLDRFKPPSGEKMPFLKLLGCGFAAGGTAAAIGT